MDDLEKWFVENIKDNMSCIDILNWYRNLYYKESPNTERYIMAWAIDKLFSDLKREGYIK